MTTGYRRDGLQRALSEALAITAVTLSMLVATSAAASDDFCSQTASLLYDACQHSVSDDDLVKQAICLNIADAAKRQQCTDDATTEKAEATQLCSDQRAGRLDACKSLGEARYDPAFDPTLFDDPRKPTNPNPYFPLKIGNRWKYDDGEGETDVVTVLNASKLMAGGVECIVVKDVVTRDRDLAEATNDWYAHAKDGTTWYCGEETGSYESFDGDDPRVPELVSIDGSFKADRNGDKGGIIFEASPKVGDVYIEESSLANAEDVTEILSTTYSFGHDSELDQGVPRKLAERFCGAGDCVVTKNFSLLEPGVFARKYYARKVGVILEVESEGQVVQLTSCNFDSRCKNLPRP